MNWAHAADRTTRILLAMPYAITQFQPTPNPHALKCILDHALPDPPRSFRSADQAGDDPLARALFAIPGVTGLLLNGGWLTINKRPETDWASIRTAAARVLSQV